MIRYKQIVELVHGKGYDRNEVPVVERIKLIELTLLQKWLRDEHNIVVELLIFDIGFLERGKFCWQWRIYDKSEDWFTNATEYKTYEEALIEAIYEALKLIQ